MRIVQCSAPGKLMLFGEHAVVYGYPCLVSAVDKRIAAKVIEHKAKTVIIEAPDVGVPRLVMSETELFSRHYPREVSFIGETVRTFFCGGRTFQGVKVRTKSDFSHSWGLGSSSAVSVAVLAALNGLMDLRVGKKELFSRCFRTVLAVQGSGSGFDVAAGVWGGTLLYSRGAKQLRELQLHRLPLMVCYSGQKADTTRLIALVARRREKEPVKVDGIFRNMAAVVQKAVPALERENWKEVGRLMNENHRLLVELGVSTPKIEKLVLAARRGGAWGVKISGAGGGDNIIVLSPDRAKASIAACLKSLGGRIISVGLNSSGVSQ